MKESDIDHENDLHEVQEDMRTVLDGFETARNAVEMILESEPYRKSGVLRNIHEQLCLFIRSHPVVLENQVLKLEITG